MVISFVYDWSVFCSVVFLLSEQGMDRIPAGISGGVKSIGNFYHNLMLGLYISGAMTTQSLMHYHTCLFKLTHQWPIRLLSIPMTFAGMMIQCVLSLASHYPWYKDLGNVQSHLLKLWLPYNPSMQLSKSQQTKPFCNLSNLVTMKMLGAKCCCQQCLAGQISVSVMVFGILVTN